VAVQKGQAGRQGDAHAVIPAHHIHSKPDHDAVNPDEKRESDKTKARRMSAGLVKRGQSGFRLGLENLATPVKTIGADVMAQMRLARGGLDSDARHGQGVVRTVHAALGRRFFVLLNGHGPLLKLRGSVCWAAR
jgi:hypothetical protein